MKLNFSVVSSSDALKYWNDSPYATIFTHPAALETLAPTVHWWLCEKQGNPICAWPICLDEAGKIYLPGGSYYIGPLWASTEKRLPEHRRLSVYLAVYEGFIEQFLRQYGGVKASLPLGLQDVRAFSWWNYGQVGQPTFTITPRYTACIEGIEQKSFEEIAAGFRQVRRYEIKQIEKGTLPELCEEWSYRTLFELYSGIYAAKGTLPGKNAPATMQKMVTLVEKGYGEVLAYRYPHDDGRLAYVALILYGNQTANLVYSMVASDYRNNGLVAWGIKNALEAAKARGCNTFDFNGANSPLRGDDKHSYGAVAKLYFELDLTGQRENGF